MFHEKRPYENSLGTILELLISIVLLFPSHAHAETTIDDVDYSTSTIQMFIKEMANFYDVDESLALAVAKAESGFVWYAKNPGSSASGVYQFIDSTFRDYCIKGYGLTESMAHKRSPEIQVECAIRMIADGGIGHWDASKHIWKSYPATLAEDRKDEITAFGGFMFPLFYNELAVISN